MDLNVPKLVHGSNKGDKLVLTFSIFMPKIRNFSPECPTTPGESKGIMLTRKKAFGLIKYNTSYVHLLYNILECLGHVPTINPWSKGFHYLRTSQCQNKFWVRIHTWKEAQCVGRFSIQNNMELFWYLKLNFKYNLWRYLSLNTWQTLRR